MTTSMTFIERQKELENNYKTNAVGKKRAQIAKAIEAKTETDNVYSKNLLLDFSEIIYEYNVSLFKKQGMSKNIVVTKHLKPLQAAWLESESDKVYDNEVFLHSLSVASVILDCLTSEPALTSVAHKMARVTGRCFNYDKETMELVNGNFITHFTKVIENLSLNCEYFDISQFNSVYYLKTTEVWKTYCAKVNDNLTVSTTQYGPMIAKPLDHHDLISTEGGLYDTYSPLLKKPNKLNGKVLPHIEKFNSKENKAFFDWVNNIQNIGYVINHNLFSKIQEMKAQGFEFEDFKTNAEDYTDAIEKETAHIVLQKNKVKTYWFERKEAERKAKATEEEPFVPGELELVTEKGEAWIRRGQKSIYREQVKLTNYIYDQCNQFANDTFYFNVFFCSRPRMYYYASWGLSPQGNELSKAMLCFADKETLTKKGVHELFNTLGNALGKDKIDITIKNEFARSWYANWSVKQDWSVFFTEKFEEPVTALAVALELVEYYKDPLNYKSGFVNHRDARISGSSLIGTTLRSKKAMALSSVLDSEVDTTSLPDAYQLCADEAYTLALNLANKGDSKAKVLVDLKDILFTRANFKHPFMITTNYGGTYYGLQKKHQELFSQVEELLDIDVEIKSLFTKLTNQAIGKLLPCCMGFLKVAKEVGTEVGKARDCLAFNNPITGFPFSVVERVKKKTVLDVQGSRRFQLVTYTYTDKINYRKYSSSCSPHLIHQTDFTCLFMATTHKNLLGKPVALIHDSIGVHANYAGEELREAYGSGLQTLANSNYWEDTFKQLGIHPDRVPHVNTATQADVDSITTSRHILV